MYCKQYAETIIGAIITNVIVTVIGSDSYEPNQITIEARETIVYFCSVKFYRQVGVVPINIE